MKRILIILAAAVLTAVSCSREVSSPVAGDGTVKASICVAANATKADPAAAAPTRCILQVWAVNEDAYIPYDSQVAEPGTGSLQFNFDLDLLRNQEYFFAAWADYGEEFYTFDAENHTIARAVTNADVSNEPRLDAFYGNTEITTGSEAVTIGIIAQRPLAQLNFIATDLTDEFAPCQVTVKYSAASAFNILEGMADADSKMDFETVCNGPFGAADQTLSSDFMFVAPEGETLGTVEIKADFSLLPSITRSFDNISIKPNFRTNVSGKILTVAGDVAVDINDAWGNGPAFRVNGTTYEVFSEAVAAAAAGDVVEILHDTVGLKFCNIPVNITVRSLAANVEFDCTGSGSVCSIPNGATFENVVLKFGNSNYHGFQHAGTINMNGCTLNGLFFSYGDMNFNKCHFVQETSEYNMWTYSGNITYNDCVFDGKGKFLNVYNEGNAEAFDIVANNCQFNSSAVNKSAFNVKETCVAKLLKFNVELNGCKTNDNFPTDKVGGSKVWMVDDLSASGESFITVKVDGELVYPFYAKDNEGNFHVADANGLFAIAKDMNSSLDKFYDKTIFIENDIDLENEDWAPIHGSQSGDYSITFNGQGHKISNVSVSDIPEDGGAGFFGHWAGTITNLELDGVRIENTINWSGALCGYFSTGTISNVTVSNVVISNLNESKCKRNGGLCGFVNASTNFSNVAVCGAAITGTEQLGGFIGSLQADGPATYNFTDCSVSDVSIYKVGSKDVTSFGTKTGGHAPAATINGDITVSGTNTLPEGSAENGWGANSL